MKNLFIAVLVMILTACNTSNSKNDALQAENTILQSRINELSRQITELGTDAKTLLKDARLKLDNKELTESKALLDKSISRQFSPADLDAVKALLKKVNLAIEDDAFNSASGSENLEKIRDYVREYPKGRYVLKAKKLIRKLESPTVPDYTSSNKTRSRRSGAQGSVRVGAICCDGSKSSATGRGACSHHGGVCQWLYN